MTIFTDSKYTALHLAVWHKNKKCVKILLEYGADASLRNKYEETALQASKDAEITEMIRKHIDTGSKQAEKDKEGGES